MSYTLVYSGTKTITVTDGSSQTIGNVTLPGKNFTSYGQPVDQNFLSLTENFASSVSGGPSEPIAGQLWYDMSDASLKYNTYDANVPGRDTNPTWSILSVAGSGSSPSFTDVDVAGNIQVDGWIEAGGNITSLATIAAANLSSPNLSNILNITPPTGVTANIHGNWNVRGNWTLGTGATLEATYADLAERHHSDTQYAVGTVVTVGGINEITACGESDAPLGVVSDQYAFLMNGHAGNQTTHPAVAYVGRVPVRIVGPISKHDKISPSYNGTAWASDASPFGWALETNLAVGEKLVLCIVK